MVVVFVSLSLSQWADFSLPDATKPNAFIS